MPALRLTPTSAFAASEFDAIGEDAGTVPEFLSHIGLLLAPSVSLNSGDDVGLLHMAPPLGRAQNACSAHVVGTVKLTVDERQKIQLFSDRCIGENESGQVTSVFQYVVRPHGDPVKSTDGTVIRERFSCAGFVVEAYRKALRRDFIDTSETCLPTVSLDELRVVYSHPYLDDPKKRTRFLNLPGDGGWPVLLPGHVLNALARDENSIRNGHPYKAVEGDEFFPSRNTSSVTATAPKAGVSSKLKTALQKGARSTDRGDDAGAGGAKMQ